MHVQWNMDVILIYLDDRKERKLIIVMHILFIFDLFSIFFDAYILGYIIMLFVLIFYVRVSHHFSSSSKKN